MDSELSGTAKAIFKNYPTLLTFQQIEELTGISTKTLHRWKDQGKLPFITRRLGRGWRVHIEQVINFIDSFNEAENKRRPGRPRKEEQYEATGRR